MAAVLTHEAGGVMTITLNRPDKKNALNEAMYAALSDALRAAESKPEIRVILLTGHSEVFTAGNDIEDFVAHPPQGKDSAVFRFMQVLSHAEKPIIAAVSGPAIGIGSTMLLHCDLVYASDTARFALPFTQLGLCPEFGVSLFLPRVAGYARAAEKLLLGEPFDARQAMEMGLLSQVLPANEVLSFAHAQADKLAGLPQHAVKLTKRLIKQGRQAGLEPQMDEEGRLFIELLNQKPAQEALSAFLERRAQNTGKLG